VCLSLHLFSVSLWKRKEVAVLAVEKAVMG